MSNYKHQNWEEAKEKALVQLICEKGGIQGNVMTGRGLFSRVLNDDADENNRRGWWGTTDKAADGIRKSVRNRINHWKNNENAWREKLALYDCYDESIDAGVRRPQPQPPAAAEYYTPSQLQCLEDAGFGPELFEDMEAEDIDKIQGRLSQINDEHHTRVSNLYYDQMRTWVLNAEPDRFTQALSAERDILYQQMSQTLALQLVKAKKKRELPS